MEQEKHVEEYEGFTVAPCVGNAGGMFECKNTAGPLPKMLRGRYTSVGKAREQIDIWERSKRPKVSKNAA